MQVEIHTVNAFIQGNEGGNPAGVVLNASRLNKLRKQTIAKKVGLSETAFVSQSEQAEFKLDFFTPTRQIAHCGHATIATFGLLLEKNILHANSASSKETIDGTRDIFLRDSTPFMQQTSPSYIAIDEYLTEILASLNISEDQLLASPTIVNTGNSFLILGVRSEAELKNIKPNEMLVNSISERHDLIGYYIFSFDTKYNNAAATRMFAPRYGISEESATGMAAGPLACYLYQQMGIKKDKFIIEQGHLMSTPSPSRIEVQLNLKNGNIESLLAGGKAKTMQKRIIQI